MRSRSSSTSEDPSAPGRADRTPVARAPSIAARWRADLLLACSGLFLVLTTAAMFEFRGGAYYRQTADHYLFFENFFSDLGGLRTYSGRDNTASRHLFAAALVLVGGSVALFGPSWRRWVTRREATLVGTIATGFAVLSGAGFVAIGFAPWDRFLDTHDAIVRATFGMLAVFIVCLTIVQAQNDAPRRFIAANVLYLIGLAVYAIALSLGPHVDTRSGLQFQVAAQKAIVYASIVALVLQAWGTRIR